jgi:hypothetical protein
VEPIEHPLPGKTPDEIRGRGPNSPTTPNPGGKLIGHARADLKIRNDGPTAYLVLGQPARPRAASALSETSVQPARHFPYLRPLMRQHEPDHRQEANESNPIIAMNSTRTLRPPSRQTARHATGWLFACLRHIICFENPRQGASRMDPWRLGTSSSRHMGAPSRSFVSPNRKIVRDWDWSRYKLPSSRKAKLLFLNWLARTSAIASNITPVTAAAQLLSKGLVRS